MKKRSKFLLYEDGSKIKLDGDDVPELTDAFFKNAKPLKEIFPDLAAYAEKRKVGRPKSANAKKLQSFKLSPDLIESIKATGAGFNVRVEAVLRQAIQENRL
jgi:uncharacterized protein (DUF4415 family)